MKYRSFIIEFDSDTGKYIFYQDTDLFFIRDIKYEADTVKQAKEEIDEMIDFDPSDV